MGRFCDYFRVYITCRAQFYQVSLVVEEDGKPLTSSEVDKKLDVSDKVWSTVMHPYERFKDAPLAAGNTGQNNKVGGLFHGCRLHEKFSCLKFFLIKKFCHNCIQKLQMFLMYCEFDCSNLSVVSCIF